MWDAGCEVLPTTAYDIYRRSEDPVGEGEAGVFVAFLSRENGRTRRRSADHTSATPILVR
jgi:hypothetical protein